MHHESRLASSTLTLAILAIGVFLLAVGLIFLCAAVERPTRSAVALVLLLAGGGLVAWSGYRWRKARLRSPDRLGERIIDLAEARDARVTLAQVISALDVTEADARRSLAKLESDGICRAEREVTSTVWVFPGLLETKVVRRCSYCGSEYPIRKPLQKCPSCGGTLEIVNV